MKRTVGERHGIFSAGEAGGRRAAIGSLARLPALIAGRAGTVIEA
jgi:hypothetical protein